MSASKRSIRNRNMKGLDTYVLLCVSDSVLHFTLSSGEYKEARIVQLDFSAAFESTNHQGILFKLCTVGIGDSVQSVLTQFLFKRSQYVVVDGCRSNLVNVVSGEPQDSVLGPTVSVL